MSVFTPPRVHFKGLTDWNPSTVNNSPGIYDEVNAQPVPQPGVTFDEYVSWLTDLAPGPNPAPNGSWNVFGDHSVTFHAAISSFELKSGGPAGHDPLVGQPIRIHGSKRGQRLTAARMVDVDPYASTTTQIFYDTISVGDATLGFTAKGTCRMFSRWPNFQRNLEPLPVAGRMGVIWQTAADKSGIEWFGVEKSPALAALKEAVMGPAGAGLSIQLASYRTLYYQAAVWKGNAIKNGADLSAAYKDGFQSGNPARSALIGTIGVWGKDELASAPTARLLVPSSPAAPPAQPAHQTRTLQESQDAQPPIKPVLLGPAMAEVDTSRNVVIVDFIATFPEKNSQLEKANLSTFALQVRDIHGEVLTIGPPLTLEKYDRAAYESTAGMVEFPFLPESADVIQRGSLFLTQQGSNTTVLMEKKAVVETDQRGVYVEQSQSASVTIAVYQQGKPVLSALKVLVAQYDNQGNLIADSANYFVHVTGQDGELPSGAVTVTNGRATLTLDALQPGCCILGFFPFEEDLPPVAPPSNFPDTTSFYAAIRVLPFDDVFRIHPPQASLTWAFIYANVLRNYNVIYPLMSTIINFGDKNAVNANAQAIAAAIAPELLPTTLSMPVTHELSDGKRALLQRYLQRVSNATNSAST